jgi:predicted dehydrogenase
MSPTTDWHRQHANGAVLSVIDGLGYPDEGAWRETWAMDGGGALMNQSIHMVDLLLYLAGEPASVHATTAALTHSDIEVEDNAVATFRFADGMLGTLAASTSCAPGFPKRLELCGDKGSIVLEDDTLVRWVFEDEQPEDEAIRAGNPDADHSSGASDPMAISHEGHRLLIEDLCAAIATGRDPMISGREGMRAVNLICAIYLSARTGAAVSLTG